jgi:hypothetical protein
MWDNTIKALDQMGKFMIQSYREKLSQPNPYTSNATYNLFTNVNYEVKTDGGSLRLIFKAPNSEVNPRTGNPWIEDGRPPGYKPPISIIEKWVIQRGIQSNNGGTTRNTAYLISRSIMNKGIKPKPYLSEVRQEIMVGTQIENLKTALLKDLTVGLKLT